MTALARLAYVCSDPGIAPDGVKGAAVHFRELARALRQPGLDVDVYMARPAEGSTRAPITVVAPEAASGVGRELQLLAASAALHRQLMARGPHVAVYERLALFGLGGLAYARARRIPLLVEVNAPLWEEAARYRELHLAAGARGLMLDLLHAADHVLAVSGGLRARLIAEGVEPAKVRVAPNGVNLPQFAAATPAARPPSLRGLPLLLFVGSLKPWHGLPLLLDGFARLHAQRRIGLWVVGDGPGRAVVEEAAARYGGDLVVEGPVVHEQIAAVHKAADVVVAPYAADSPTYFCPLKVVEALAAGCPLVAASIDGVRELVDDAAVLHAPGDVDGFVAAVQRLLDDPTERTVLAARGVARAQARFDWRHRASEIHGLLGFAPAGALA